MLREIKTMTLAQPAMDGDGVALHRNDLFTGRLDPFLMLDEMKSDPSEKPNGFPVHPHRGIQTLSYMIHGSMQHKDSMGNASQINRDSLQWMHTGKGILHSETPIVDQDGLWGFQFWLNVPRDEKYQSPQYEDFTHTGEIDLGQATLKVLAGEWSVNQAQHGSAFHRLAGNAGLADIEWQSQQTVQIQADEPTLAIFVISGSVQVNGKDWVKQHQLVEFNKQSGEIELTAIESGSRVLVFKGQPINEPIYHRGPFVMTNEAEMAETLEAYRNGTLA